MRRSDWWGWPTGSRRGACASATSRSPTARSCSGTPSDACATAPARPALVAERIRRSAERDRFTPENASAGVNVTLSIGYALFPAHANTTAGLIEAADRALYRSKQEGRNRVTVAEGPVAPPASTEPPKARRRKG